MKRRALLGLLIYGHTEGLENQSASERGRVMALDNAVDLVAALNGNPKSARGRGTS